MALSSASPTGSSEAQLLPELQLVPLDHANYGNLVCVSTGAPAHTVWKSIDEPGIVFCPRCLFETTNQELIAKHFDHPSQVH